MTGSMQRRRDGRLVLAVTVVSALVAALLPMGAVQAQSAQPEARDAREFACSPEEEYEDFSDIEGNAFEDLIRCLVTYGITQGGPGGLRADEYGPSQTVRRDQMASFIHRALEAAGVDLPEPSDQGFTDTAGNVHDDSIHRLAAAGIVLGGPEGRPADEYGPALRTRRDQMATFLARALAFATDGELPREAQQDYFTDVPADSPHAGNINDLAGEGIVQGRGGATYASGDFVRRDAMSAFIMRSVDLLIEEGFAESIFDDNSNNIEDNDPPEPQ